MSFRYDVAVIGTGPAGLSAAITLKIRNKNIILFGKHELSEKLNKAHEIQNYLGLPFISGEEMSEKFRTHLNQMNVEITDQDISMIYAMGDYFTLQTKKNDMIEATAVILATGVNFGNPYEGEEQYLGRGVSYCATCDAPLYRDKTVAVIAASEKEKEEAVFLSEVASKVFYIPLYGDEQFKESNVQVVNDQPISIAGAMKANKLILKNEELDVDGVFILRDAISPKNLVPGISMDGAHVAVNRQMETSIPGCFACGDITGSPYQFIKAAGEGNVAAISAVQYLSGLQKG